MTDDSAIAASDLIIDCWQQGAVIDALPESLMPKTRSEGYQIQSQIVRLSTEPVWGWKIAATSEAGQAHIGVDGPLAGRLLSEMVFQNGAEVPFGANRMRVAEAEFAFCLGKDLPPRPEPYEQHEVMKAVSDLYLGIEFPDSRFQDFVTAGGPQLIADNACAHRFVIGPKAPDSWRDTDLVKHKVRGKISDRTEYEGIGANVLGDPKIALTWLANELSNIGVTLAAGQIVTTGTCVVPMEIRAGDSVLADFGSLGQVSCRLSQN